MLSANVLIYLAGSYATPAAKTQLKTYTSSISFNSDPIPVHGVYGCSLQIVWPATGSPVGTFKLQSSNDVEAFYMTPDASVVNWTDVTGATVSIIAAGGTGTIEAFSASRWFRLAYTAGSGTGTFSVNSNIKSMH